VHLKPDGGGGDDEGQRRGLEQPHGGDITDAGQGGPVEDGGQPAHDQQGQQEERDRSTVEALENSTDRLKVSPLVTKKTGMRKP